MYSGCAGCNTFHYILTIKNKVLYEKIKEKFVKWHYLLGYPFSPRTKNREHLSASVRILTFCRILWQRLRISRSLQISLTSSKISSRSSRAKSSCRLLRPARLLDGRAASPGNGSDKNVGMPSTVVFTMGLKRKEIL